MSDEHKPQKNNEERKRDIGKALLKGYCLPVRMESGQCLLYEIVDQAAREVRIITSQSPLEQVVASGYDALQDHMKLYKVVGEATVPVRTLTMRQVGDIVERYVTEQQEIRDIAQFAWKDDKRYTLKRITFDLSDGPTPAWDEFTTRLSDPTAFKAWIWSVLEYKHRGRQALWINGPKGQDGKSTILNCLGELVGNACAVLDGSERDNRFVHSNLFDRRLLIYPDCKQPSVVKGQIYRNYTGGDYVSVEFKGMQPFSKKVYARLAISANYLPTIDEEGADRSRLLIVTLSPSDKNKRSDGTWADRLKEELPFFLWACKKAYEERCPDHYLIKVSDLEEHDELLSQSSSGSEERWEMLVHKYFNLVPAGKMERYELPLMLETERMKSTEVGAFKRYLLRSGVTDDRETVDGKRVRIYRGIERKDKHLQDELNEMEERINRTKIRQGKA